MLSALILSRHSYPAVARAGQLVDQRSVHPDPLVQRTASLKYQRLRQIGTNLSHDGLTYNSVITNSIDYNFLALFIKSAKPAYYDGFYPFISLISQRSRYGDKILYLIE